MALTWLTLLLTLHLISFAHGQLIGPVGPTTPLTKKVIECNVLDYGAKADNETNVAPAILAAYEDCVRPNPGSRLIVPEGNYLTTEDIVLANATNWAFQLDGLITA
jgi:rhamnogalacturonan hydrolase